MQPSGGWAAFCSTWRQRSTRRLSRAALHTALKMALRLDLDLAKCCVSSTKMCTRLTPTRPACHSSSHYIDPLSGKIEHASAGIARPVETGPGWQQWSATMPPLGVLPNAAPTPLCAELSANDLLILYSDGFSEIETEAGLWGMEG